MRRIRLILTIAVVMAVMVLCFTVPAMAYGPRGLIGEGRTDIKEGRHFIQEGQALLGGGQREVQRGKQAIREGRADIRQGQRGVGGH